MRQWPFRIYLFTGLAVALLVSGLMILLPNIRLTLDRNDDWVANAEQTAQHSATGRLFDSAVAHDVIYYDSARDMISVRSQREVRFLRQQRAKRRPPWGRTIRDRPSLSSSSRLDLDTTLKTLWRGRGPGYEIRQEIDRAMRARLVLGVRDAGLTRICSAFRPDHCEGAGWNLAPAVGDDALLAPALAGEGAMQPEFRIFGPLENKPDTAFGDWNYLGARTADEAAFLATPNFDPVGAAQVTLDIIGRLTNLDDVPIDGEYQVSFYCMSVGLISFGRVERCDTPEKAVVTRLEFSRPQWRDGANLIIQPVRLPILRKNWQDTQRSGVVRINDRISLVCKLSSCKPSLDQKLRWRRATRDLAASTKQEEALKDRLPNTTNDPRAEDTRSANADVVQPFLGLSDFVDVTEPGVYAPSQLTEELELVPVVGLPAAKRGSFIELLENLPPGVAAQDLDLTIDQRAQRTALRVFQSFLQDRDFQFQQDSLIDVDNNRRRAAFILLDLRGGEEAGAIRVALGYPFFDGTRSAWSLGAMAYQAEARSSLTPFAWRGLDSRFAPGSSMKIASALSLVRTATGQTQGTSQKLRSDIARAITGMGKNEFSKTFKWNLATRTRPFFVDRSPSGETFPLRDRGAPVFPAKPGAHQSCGSSVDAAGNPTSYGLCEALARSSNIWFGSMALSENQRLKDGLYAQTGKGHLFTGLGQTLIALGLHKPAPLVRFPDGISVDQSFGPRGEAPLVGSAPGLQSETLNGPISKPDLEIALNAYGQLNMQATPLTMATLAGSVAMGQSLSPYIASTATAVRPIEVTDLVPQSELGQELLATLRRGMRAVVSKGGTGLGFFSVPEAASLRGRVFAKTGTGELVQALSNYPFKDRDRAYIHWLVGWVNDKSGSPSYAFACMVSHVHNKKSPCSPLSAAILSRIERQPVQ